MSLKVLIVDDSQFMRDVIKEAMENAGFEVVGLAPNGETAIDLAYSLKPDVITLDNILPDMIGEDVLKVIKSTDDIAAKVVIVSAVGQESDIQEGLSLGASDYIIKPFSSQELVDVINRVAHESVA
jgi:two-component system chemotaxis response regulator CheY